MKSSAWEAPTYEVKEFNKKKSAYCIIVVTWNEGPRIMNQLARMKTYSELVDIIVADGRSSDGSTKHNFLQDSGVRTLLVTDELGLSTATRMGLAYAIEQEYSGVITVDGNGKDGIEAIPQFINKLDEGYDLIQGSRFMKGGIHKNTPLDRYIGVRYIVAPLIAFAGFWYSDPTNAFRAMSMNFLRDARLQPIRSVFVRFNLQLYLIFRAAKLKFKVCEIPVMRTYPEDGSVPTKITHWGSKLLLIWELFATVLGRYNPR